MTPADHRRSSDGYFPPQYDENYIPGPDFVNLDEKLEAVGQEDSMVEDEAHVRRLVKRGSNRGASWFGNVLGFKLFSVDENEEEEGSEGDGNDDEATEGECENEPLTPDRKRLSVRSFDGIATLAEEKMPAPRADEGGWQDAAWLLSVASKVLL
jgi:hypothetical protein